MLIKVTGCGITAIGEKGSPSLAWIIQRIVDKGGKPEVVAL